MTQAQTQTPEQVQTPKWRTLLELHRPYLALSLAMVELERKKYIMVFADDFSDWKEFAIYTSESNEEDILSAVEKIKEIIEKAESDPEYDPVPEIASLVSEIVDQFIIGEIPEEMGICSEDEYVATPEEDERLNWPLCYSKARPHLLLLYNYNLLPEEWTPHINQNILQP